jgi:membrane protease YdiL (CAAX protease family)
LEIGGVHFDGRVTLLVILSTILPMVDYYNHRITGLKPFDRFVLYFIIPLIIILLVFRERPGNYGLRLGDWRTGLRWTLIGCAGMALVLWFAARHPTMASFYEARAPEGASRIILLNGIEMWGWEFMWRGLLLFGLARALGPGPAIWLQAVPFAFMHLGKPEIETFTTIFGGAAFGYIAWQSGSFLYPFLIHWFILSFTMLLATGRIG